MTAAKTREGRRAALAKTRDTQRKRTVGELKEEGAHLVRKLRWSADGRRDIEAVADVVREAISLLSRDELGVDQLDELDRVTRALGYLERRPIYSAGMRYLAVPLTDGGRAMLERAIVAATAHPIPPFNPRSSHEYDRRRQEAAVLQRRAVSTAVTAPTRQGWLQELLDQAEAGPSSEDPPCED